MASPLWCGIVGRGKASLGFPQWPRLSSLAVRLLPCGWSPRSCRSGWSWRLVPWRSPWPFLGSCIWLRAWSWAAYTRAGGQVQWPLQEKERSRSVGGRRHICLLWLWPPCWLCWGRICLEGLAGSRSCWENPDALPRPTIPHHRGLTTTRSATMQDSPLYQGEDPVYCQPRLPGLTRVHPVHDEARPAPDTRRRQEATEGLQLPCTHLQALPDARIRRYTHYDCKYRCLIWCTPGPQDPHGGNHHPW